MKAIFGILAVVLLLIGFVPYIRDIVHGDAKPHRVTWGIWAILTTIGAVNQIKNGGGYSSLFFIVSAAVVFVILLLSIKYGMPGFSKIDLSCLVAAFLLLVYWVTVRDTRISTLLAVIIDAVAILPTIIKVYYHPSTETYTVWILAGVSGLLSIMAVTKLDWALIIYPAYIFVMNGVVVGTKYAREKT